MKALLSELAPYKNGDLGSTTHSSSAHCRTILIIAIVKRKNWLQKAKADGDWNSYIFLHERPYRVGALEYASESGLGQSPSEYWRLVGGVWLDLENILEKIVVCGRECGAAQSTIGGRACRWKTALSF